MYCTQDNLKEALTCFNHALKNGLNVWRVLWYKANVLFGLEKTNEAKIQVREVLKIVPTFEPALELLEKLIR